MVDLSREEQDKMIAEFIEKNGATRLPPDARLGLKVATQTEAETQAKADSEREGKEKSVKKL